MVQKADVPDNKKNNFTEEDPGELFKTIVNTLIERKGEQVTHLDLREITTLADHFIICNGLSETHVKSLADEVSEKTRETVGEKPWRKEGLETRRWIVLDFVNIVVHIFREETREHYALEKMWSDAPRKNFDKEI